VIPRLKKDGLEKENPANYRPISNLNNISKILERLFLTQLHPHVTCSPLFNPHQSAYRRHHSTETALLLNLDHIYHAADNGEATLYSERQPFGENGTLYYTNHKFSLVSLVR
jgi:hypothetical protein